MKKLLFGMSALVLMFTSCNGNDDEGSNPGNVLLKKTVEVGTGGEADYISTATYNGKKLVKISSNDGDVVEFTYTGDNITKMTWKAGADLLEEQLYTYDSAGNLATHVMLDHESQTGSKEVFTHGNNVVTVQTFSGNLTSQTLEGDPYTLTFANGEVVQNSSVYGTTTYTYDDKNNPFKNVTGYSKISFVDGAVSGIMHNVKTEAYSSGASTVYTYTYNANNYPTQAVETTGSGDVTTTKFYY